MKEEIERPTRENNQETLFDIPEDWRKEWWGMPSFNQKDARPIKTISVNFLTPQDIIEFKEKLGVKISKTTDSIWYRPQTRLNGEFEYHGPKIDSRYPICIPSKGRADCQTTGKVLDRMGVSYKFFVEEKEANIYKRYLGSDKVVVMPFSDLGKGSIPARNFIWEYAKERGFERHWVVDDNISAFARCTNNRRLNVRSGNLFRAMEDWVDRYNNIALAGPHDKAYSIDRDPNLTPYLLNSRVYSCILIKTDLPYRWRGRYNEDTDLSLRALKDGWCTVLFRALLMDKSATYYGDGKSNGAMKGGNTDSVYNNGDYRRAFAESLQKQHPDIVKVVWKFNRWHHQVDYSPFKKNKLIRKEGIVPIEADNEYGLELVKIK